MNYLLCHFTIVEIKLNSIQYTCVNPKLNQLDVWIRKYPAIILLTC